MNANEKKLDTAQKVLDFAFPKEETVGPETLSVFDRMCQVSNQIYQRHDFALSGVCKRCGYKMTI